MSRHDPIRKRYFDYVEMGDKLSDVLFYAGALLSIVSLLADKQAHPAVYDGVLTAFGLAVLGLFIVGLASRLYLTPRADDQRRKDFFSNACGVSLTQQKTDGYYNNDLTDPIKRMAAQVLENSLFSQAIALRMVRIERAKVVVYLVIWLLCLFHRQTDLGLVVAVSQTVFSEQLLSKWIRLEWLRMRFERTYDDMYRTFQSNGSSEDFTARTLDSLGMYETAKANAAITLSSRIFQELNPSLSAEWEQLKVELKI